MMVGSGTGKSSHSKVNMEQECIEIKKKKLSEVKEQTKNLHNICEIQI